MKIKYFEDTDTALFEFGAETPAEPRAISEDVYLDIDKMGHVVSITTEHARTRSDLSEFSFVRINQQKKAAMAMP